MMYRLLFSVVALFALAGRTLADCESFGYDFVDGGGPYCINTTSSDYFSFGTEFEGTCLVETGPYATLTVTRLPA